MIICSSPYFYPVNLNGNSVSSGHKIDCFGKPKIFRRGNGFIKHALTVVPDPGLGAYGGIYYMGLHCSIHAVLRPGAQRTRRDQLWLRWPKIVLIPN